ncbi:MAG: hypothetical protein HYR70_04120 [Chloroflexi bacterium]|nr:hypothetical protein [Chloroflexota bacterium]MBI3340742.1 hypothetical protein [Chloroflexota bacterium]
MPNYIPIKEAAKRLRVSVKTARVMLKSGKIQGGVLPDGEMIVVADSVPTLPVIKKEDLPEYKKFDNLKDSEISINEAGRKYKISSATITRWAQKGIIKRINSDGYRTFLAEQDVAYCAKIYHDNKGQGKWLFDKDGTPHKPRTGPLTLAE